ncbi:MAG: metallophosphoesterase family protein [Trueperaceae bacterium]
MRPPTPERLRFARDRPAHVAILADVHGIFAPLAAVLADLETVRPDRVVVNGDLVNRGPDGVAVLERLERVPGPRVLGNHDDLMRMWVERDPALPPAWFDEPFWRGNAWCAERLERSGWLDRIATWPLAVRLDVDDGPSALVTHGSPRHYREGYGPHLADASVSEIAEMHPVEMFVGSHTHRPMDRTVGRHRVVNTGAVGTPFNGDPRAHYLLLHGDGTSWEPEFRRVAYDREAALESFETSGYLEHGGLAARIHWVEAATARSLLTPFLMWCDERDGAALDLDSWRRFVRERAGRIEAPDDVGARVVRRSDLAGPGGTQGASPSRG